MRKHDVRKWLHVILDLLPVILIPVFMIYSHRHTIDSGSIQVPQNQVVDFNQKFAIRNFSYDYNGSGNHFTDLNYFEGYANHKVLLKYTFNHIVNTRDVSTSFYFSGVEYIYNVLNNEIITLNVDGDYYLSFAIYQGDSGTYKVSNMQLFDLTQMFGSGNEPTLQQFNELFSDDYYDYTLSHKELLKGTSTITYDDTDIMSQVVYQLYNSVDKYFNMGNVFNMTGVYDWFSLNIFNGNAPISIYIVWNIVLYEFVMDLLFLLYGLFMWFIDMVEKLMEKPLKSVK